MATIWGWNGPGRGPGSGTSVLLEGAHYLSSSFLVRMKVDEGRLGAATTSSPRWRHRVLEPGAMSICLLPEEDLGAPSIDDAGVQAVLR